ncbi:helix-turn-helix domain-containing protein [Mucilaginibacter pedocola]|uniref:Helix-turn-helix domain-containing protein n=1 Tax=Mucilaginibacter pedocola TaxID=1792845 RepID=A0A1S9P828_9SPHI|nr:helix-turn-helix domain-containing protein [Mucilaginibacter pedocola]OOQ57123.1 hypothetical protein BC343_16515 [Mucilaginibacter pedocola]
METIIQASATEFIQMVRDAVREELSALKPTAREDRPAANKKEAAAALRVSLSTLERLIKSGEVPIFNIGKKVFIKNADIEAYLNKKG